MIWHELFCRAVCTHHRAGPAAGPRKLDLYRVQEVGSLGQAKPGCRHAAPWVDCMDGYRGGACLAHGADPLVAVERKRFAGFCLECGCFVCHAGVPAV